MTALSIRVAERQDVPILAALHAVGFDDAWPHRALDDLMAMPGTFALIAEAPAGPQGFVLARVAAREAEILTVTVRREARCQGIGRALVVAAADHAARSDAEALFLEVAVDNVAGLGLYAALGFTSAGRRKGYYTRPLGLPADALVMKVDLPLAEGSVGNKVQRG